MNTGARPLRSRQPAGTPAQGTAPGVPGPAAARALSPARKAALAIACVAAGFLPVSVGYLPDAAARLACGVAAAAGFLALAMGARRSAAMRRHWEIPLAYFGMALFVLADRYVPGFLAARLLHSPPVPGNPLSSNVPGTVVVELDELLLTVLAVLAVLLVSGRPRSSVYLRRGRPGRAYAIGILGLAAFYALAFSALSHSRFIPVHGAIDLARYLSLTPALLAAVGANGFLEELMFRGLLMSRLEIALGPRTATFIQAAVFASWHVGVTYTASALVFAVLLAFPLGLVCGYLTRSAGSIIPSALFHAGADIPVYLAFLSYAA